jgi:hypothetical protein
LDMAQFKRLFLQSKRKPLDPDTRRRILAKTTTEDLDGLVGRFCGPSNALLCEKTFGVRFSKEDVEQEIIERTLFASN